MFKAQPRTIPCLIFEVFGAIFAREKEEKADKKIIEIL
jgi:hypothetical protein